MTEQRRPLHKVQLTGGLGKSIFPPFAVNAPMPRGTAVPPRVVVKPAGGEGGTAPRTGAAGSSQTPKRPTKR